MLTLVNLAGLASPPSPLLTTMYTVECLEQKSLTELKEIGRQLNALPAGDKRRRQNWIDAIVGVQSSLPSGNNFPVLVEAAWPIELQHQEPIDESFGLTFSPRFLALYSPPQIEQISYKADADGQLSLLDFDVEFADEPPDPDDFESLDAFWEAMTVWNAEHPEPLEPSLDSFSEWAPCPLEWYESEETSESSTESDRAKGSDEPPTSGVGVRLPLLKPPSFPPIVVVAGDRANSIKKFARCAILFSGRAPPGGDVA